MSLHPPRVHRYAPPSEAEAAASRATFARQRAERDAAREAARPARRAAILAGPALRDVDAAVDCLCACHPRPAEVGLHNGGPSCQCQQTEVERAARMKALREGWNDHTEMGRLDAERYSREQRQLVADEAEALGVEARIATDPKTAADTPRRRMQAVPAVDHRNQRPDW